MKARFGAATVDLLAWAPVESGSIRTRARGPRPTRGRGLLRRFPTLPDRLAKQSQPREAVAPAPVHLRSVTDDHERCDRRVLQRSRRPRACPSTGGYGQLAQHLVEVTRPLVPKGVALLAADPIIALVETRSSGPLHAVDTRHMSPPEEDLSTAQLAVLAGYLLSDLQDLVAEWQNSPWPVNTDGVPLHVAAEAAGEQILLRFVGRGVNSAVAPIDRPPFPIPPPPPSVQIAG
jgi:hypothetical protein